MICVTISQFTILTHLPEITDRLEYTILQEANMPK
jgi:hypothetical protein